MKFIKPSVEIINEPDLFKRIEIAARTCYKSESRRTDESAQKMIPALIKRGHESPLEHSLIALECFERHGKAIWHVFSQCADESPGPLPFSTGWTCPYYPSDTIEIWMQSQGIRISANYRVWLTVMRYIVDHWGDLSSDVHIVASWLVTNCREFSDIVLPPSSDVDDNTFWAHTEYNINDAIAYCGLPYTVHCRDYGAHGIITARFICDRGVSHELVRHRCLSFSQESTRYINYKDGLTFVEPWWWPEQETSDTQFIRASCQAAEDAYCSLIASGASPQKARCVLPNMLKTEVVATGTVEQWKKLVLPLRLSKAAHPDIRRLMELFCGQLGWNPDDFRK